MPDPDTTYFFMHIMKTGGTTFIQHVRENFAPEAVYPLATEKAERRRAYFMIDGLRSITPEQRQSIRMYTGHFPFVASQIVDADVTLSILRHPVARTLSYLRHCKRHRDHMVDMNLEQIYEDPWLYAVRIHNYQAKLFSMTTGDKLASDLEVIDVDGRRLEIALENLERVTVIGLHEKYTEFLETLRSEHGWTIGRVPNLRVTEDRYDVPAGLPERIAADNSADMMLYERACELYAGKQHVRRSNARG
jgi:hypothetical protein